MLAFHQGLESLRQIDIEKNLDGEVWHRERERQRVIKYCKIRVSMINLLPDPFSVNSVDTLSGFIICVPRIHFMALLDRALPLSHICS